MAKILNNDFLNDEVQRLVETTDGLIINANYYDKNNMTPKPFILFPMLGSNNIISLNKTAYLDPHGIITNRMQKTPMIIKDINDSTISYIFSYRYDNVPTKGNYISKIQENTDESVTYLNSKLITDSSLNANWALIGIFPQIYLGQNEDYLFYIFTSAYNASGNNYGRKESSVCSIKKSDLSIKALYSTYNSYASQYNKYSVPFLITETQDSIFFGWSTATTSSINQDYIHTFIYKLSKDSNTVNPTPIYDINNACFSNITPIQKIDDTNGYLYMLLYDKTQTEQNKYRIHRITIDTSNDTTPITIDEDLPIIWNSDLTDLPFILDDSTTYNLFINEKNSVKYLNVAITRKSEAAYNAMSSKLGIYTFRITSTGFSYTGFVQFHNSANAETFLLSSDNSFMTVLTTPDLLIFTFSVAEEHYLLAKDISCNPTCVGIDLDDQIWYLDGSQNTNMISPSVPVDYIIKYKESKYKYTGTDIDTSIIISAKNYDGEYIEAQLKIDITGPMIFTSNNSKSIQEPTLTTGPKEIPVKITERGNITLHPKCVLS